MTAKSAQDIHLQWTTAVEEFVENHDMQRRDNFHHAMYMIASLGLDHTVFAKRCGSQPTTVAKWIDARKAPPLLRRKFIIRDALHLMKEETDKGRPLLLRDITEQGVQPARPLLRLVKVPNIDLNSPGS